MARDDLSDRKFLGREFLTWLIFHADEENGGGDFPAGDEVDAFRVRPGARVVLRSVGEGAGEITARGAAPAQSADVRYAIAGGLTVQEADLLLTRGEQVWQVAVHAELFDIKRAKVPEMEEKGGKGEAEGAELLDRLDRLEELDAMLQAAYQHFLRARLQPAWEKDQLPRIHAWLARSCLPSERDRIRA